MSGSPQTRGPHERVLVHGEGDRSSSVRWSKLRLGGKTPNSNHSSSTTAASCRPLLSVSAHRVILRTRALGGSGSKDLLLPLAKAYCSSSDLIPNPNRTDRNAICNKESAKVTNPRQILTRHPPVKSRNPNSRPVFHAPAQSNPEYNQSQETAAVLWALVCVL